MIKVKLNRGPSHGTRMVLEDNYNDVVEVTKPPTITEVIERKEFGDADFLAPLQRGQYRRSNRQLKDGTWIYEWMGWYG